ncbi:MAG: hypothetical protein CL483_07015 [Acidobacteria bacterium]|nr:hypothetical protein [Acidobacteriota bacterium]
MSRLRTRLIALALAGVGLASGARAAVDAPLVEAASRGDAGAVRALLDEGADPDERQGDGATALHWAVHRGDVSMVETLLATGATVDAVNELEVTPLLLAASNGQVAVVDRLLAAGADPEGGITDRERPLMRAAWVGSTAVVRALLDAGADPNGMEPARQQTALMWAVSERHPDVVQLLLDRGADVAAATVTHRTGRAATRDIVGYTPLLFAARVGDAESLRLLIDFGADPNAASSDGMSALILATVRGYPDVAMQLLDAGADPNAADPGYSALHWAAGWWETTLTTTDFRPDREGNDEWNSLPGLTEGKAELVAALLATGADPNLPMERTPPRAGATRNPSMPELRGATPYLLAAAAGDAEVMRLLAGAGADLTLTTDAGATPLMAAAGFGRMLGENTVDEERIIEAARLALELGADLSATDEVENTALHYAAYHRLTSLVGHLVEQGAVLGQRNKFGETPLWLSELAIQFYGGGTYQIVPTVTGDLLRTLGADPTTPFYDRARPRDWPDLQLQ